jgi:phosphoserine phosphatase
LTDTAAAALPLQPLSTASFFARVHARTPRVAVFDCDGTLWSGDAGSSFMRWSMNHGRNHGRNHGGAGETGLLSPAATAWMNARYEGYKHGEVSELAICGEMVQVYRGLPVDQLRRAAADFFRQHIEPHIFPEMAELVAALQRNGCDIWAVSSTCDWVVEEGVSRFHIPANRVLAACVEYDSAGLATDQLRDVPTGEGKVDALRRAGITAPDAVFGNSVHDAAMLEIARTAFPVNPSPELLHLSALHQWPVYFPAASDIPAAGVP